MAILIARHQEDISLNHLEYAVNQKGELFKFETEEFANSFLLSSGYTQSEIDETITFKEVPDEQISTS